MSRTKVFVGNLSFKTKEPELVQAFSAAGKVLEAHIITRGSRSLGYGFVDFGSEEEAQRAVQLMNKKDINERPINCEIAKPRPEEPAQGQQQQQQGGAPQQQAQGGAAQRPPRPRRQPRQAGGPGAAPQQQQQQQQGGQQQQGQPQQQQGGAAPAGQRPRRRRAPRRRQGVAPGGSPQQGGPAPQQQQQGGQQQQGAPQQQQQPRAPRQRPPRQEQPKNPSSTTLFVANLPFSVTDADLSGIFASSGHPPKAAHVVIKKNNRSKGFGFVEFATEDEQKRALAAVDKKQVDGRELAVKIALTELPAAQAASAAAAGQQ